MEDQIKDLITLPEVRTVVQLSDLADPALQEALLTGFVLTEDVLANLTIVMDQIVSGRGTGVFLEGSYGSGKSHFLTIISLLLSKPAAWNHFLKKNKKLTDYYRKIKNKRYLPVTISLVSHAGRESLEQILCTYLNQAVATEDREKKNDLFFDNTISRRQNFDRLSIILKNLALDGVFVLIDELSEFLRSKADGRSFNEDIRFLQFLGEYSQKNPFWLMASLQERLEEIGAINEDSFNKIKDRYRIRLFLTAEHIEALIRNRLILKKEGAQEKIDRLYASFKEAFSRLETAKDRFYELYPLHPHTLALLDELKFLFSQRRGIVDFIHYQIKGDSSRKIAGLMDQPADRLLGPEYIFDHFLVRIRETTQTRMYYQTVYGYYAKELDSLFADKESRSIARRLVKILLLKAFSPHRKGLTVKELGEMILCTITSLDSSVNYRYLADILERLYKEGAYLTCQKGHSFYEDVYRLDLKEDIQSIIRQKAEYIRQGLLPDDDRIFDCLSEWMDDPALPLAGLIKKEETRVYVKWQKTAREGFVCVRSLEAMSTDVLRPLYDDFGLGETDFTLFIDRLSQNNRDAFYQKTLIRMKEMGERLPFIFWLPDYPQDDGQLRSGLVYFLLLKKYKDDFTDTGRRIYEHLSASFQERRDRVVEIFKQAYFNGELVYLNREGVRKVNEVGILPFDKLLQRIVSPCLNQLYPLHKDIAPLSDYFIRETLHKTIERFFRPGEIIFEPGMDKGVEILIEGYLKPLKVLKQIPRGFKLHVDPAANKIVSLALAELKGGRVNLNHLYLIFRKGGDYGLSKNQFEMLILALLFSGQVRGFSSGREVNIQRPDFLNIWNIEEIGEGELIAPALREMLLACPFIPHKLKKGGFSLILQQKAWDALIEAKRTWSADEEGFLQMLRNMAGYKSLAHLDLHSLEKDYYTVRAMFQEIKVSYPAKDGLERFLIYYQGTPFLNDAYKRLERIREFTFHGLDIYTSIFSYMTDPALVIPEKENYASLLDLREEVLETLFDRERIFSEGYGNDLTGIFNRFKEAYALRYQEEHQRVRSRDTFAPYLHLKESARYRLLARISQISMISVEDDLVKVNRYLAEIETLICRGVDADQLRKRPACLCGFKLGETVTPLPLQQIEETIDRGLLEYIETLKEPRYREQITSYAVSLEDVGKGKEAKRLRRLLDFKLGGEADIKALEELLSERLIRGLNEAFEGKVVIVERDIHELLENIIERNFPKDKLVSIFSEWLNKGKTLGSDVYVKITYKAQRAKDYPLAGMVKHMFPELIPFMNDTGEELFQYLLITCIWAQQHALPLGPVFRAFACITPHDFDEDTFGHKCGQVFGSFCRQMEKDMEPLLEETETSIISKGISARLLDLVIKETGEEELLRRLTHEFFFCFSAAGITAVLIKRLYSERDRANIKKMLAVIEQWTNDPSRQRERDAFVPQRVDVQRYVGLLRNFSRILLALEWLTDTRLSEFDAGAWEKAFLDHGSRFELLSELTIKDLRDLNLGDSISIKAFKKENDWFLSQFQKGFSEYISREYKSLIASPSPVPVHIISEEQRAADSGPWFVHSVRFHFFEKYRKKLKPDETHFLLIDGMRWDIWDYCQYDLIRALNDTWRIVDQMPLWVFLPSTTSSQIGPIMTGEPPLPYKTEEIKASSSGATTESGLYRAGKEEKIGRFFQLLPEKEGVFTYKYNFIDDKLHSSGEDLLTIFSEIKLHLQSSLTGYMNRLSVKSMVILFSDHGFIKKKSHPVRDRKESPYSHGGNSPWEMIVPLVVFYKWR